MNRQQVRSRSLRGILILLVLAAGGCSSTRPTLSPTLEAAREASRKGLALEQAGRPAAAQAAFEQALKGYASIEAVPDVARSLVNLARVERRRSNLDGAAGAIERALALPLDEPALKSEIAFEQALLLLTRGEDAKALDWALQALAGAADAASRGRDRNLVARVLLRQGQPGPAGEESRKALDELGADQLAERGNAHRVLGEIALAARDDREAAGQFAKALALDKQAGRCPRIVADLRGLAHAAQLRQDSKAARAYLQRAFAVASAGDRFALARTLLGELAGNFRAGGDEATARRLEAEGQRLADLAAGQNH